MPDRIILQYEADVKKLKSDLKKVEKEMGVVQAKADKSAKGMTSSFQNVGRTIKGIGVTLGVVFGAAQLISLVTKAIGTLKKFEKELSTLQSITGSSTEQMEEFAEASKEIGKVTLTSATEVVRAFTLVGSAQPELLKNAEALQEVTKQALILAKAGGIDVVTAANALTGAMNQFGASADDAAKFTDILATSQQKGSSFINATAEALKNAGSAARAAGLTFEETNVAIQALAKGSVLGAEAGTKLRGILIRLSTQANKDLNPSFNAFSDVVQNLVDEEIDLVQATKLVGQENASALLTLRDQNAIVQELTGNLNEQGNALEQMNINMNNLDGRIASLNITWEAFVLNQKDGVGLVSQLVLTLERAIIVLDGATEATKRLARRNKTSNEELWEQRLLLEESLKRELTAGELLRSFFFGFNKDQLKLVETQKALTESTKEQTKSWFDEIKAMKERLDIRLKNLEPDAKIKGTIKSIKEEIDKQTTKLRENITTYADAKPILENISELEDKIAVIMGKETKAQIELREEREKALKVLERTVEVQAKDIEASEERILNLRDELEILTTKDDTTTEIDETAQKRLELERDRQIQEIENSKAFETQKAEEILLVNQIFQEEILALEKEGADKRKDNEIKASKDRKRIIAEEERFKRDTIRSGGEAIISLVATIGGKRATQSKSFALFEIAVNQGIAISEALKDAQQLGIDPISKTFFYLQAIAQILSATAQARSVIDSAPTPEFAKGTESAPGGLAIVGEKGTEAVMLPKGSAVISHDPTIKYKDEIKAMNSGTFESLIADKYILPSVNKQAQMKQLGDNISASIKSTFDDTGIRTDIRKNKDVNIRNAKQMSKFMADAMMERDYFNRRYR